MSLNWPNLVSKGRAKDIGIAWNDAELEALRSLHEHTGLEFSQLAPFVRNGVLTVEDHEKAKDGKAPKTRKELEAEASEAGVEFAPEAPDTVLEKEIASKKNTPKTK